MLQFVVSVQDRASGVFMRPFFVPHRNVAIRDFTDEVNRKADDNQLNKHPDDFDLYLLANYYDDTGHFHQEDGPVLLVRAKDVFNSAVATV